MRQVAVTVLVAAAVLVGVGLFMFNDDGSPVVALPDGPPKVVPKAVLIGSASHDFGTMYQLTKGEHEFRIRNEGEVALQLSKGGTSCGCTGMEVTKEPIPPGQEGVAVVHWKTKMSPDFSESANVVTNDPTHREISLAIKGHVIKPYNLSASEIQFGALLRTEAATRTIDVWSEDMAELKVVKVETPSNRFESKVSPMPADALKRRRGKVGYQIALTLLANGPAGKIDGSLVITTNHPKRPTTKITVEGKVIGDVTFQPEQINFLYIYPKGKTASVFIYKRGSGKALEVKLESHSPKFLDVKLEHDPTKAAPYRLVVTVPAGAPAGALKGEVRLKTNSDEVPHLVVPLEGLILTGTVGAK